MVRISESPGSWIAATHTLWSLLRAVPRAEVRNKDVQYATLYLVWRVREREAAASGLLVLTEFNVVTFVLSDLGVSENCHVLKFSSTDIGAVVSD